MIEWVLHFELRGDTKLMGVTYLYHSKESPSPNVFYQNYWNKKTPIATQWKVCCLSSQIAHDLILWMLSLMMSCFCFSSRSLFVILTEYSRWLMTLFSINLLKRTAKSYEYHSAATALKHLVLFSSVTMYTQSC